ncbi:Protein ZGRF1 [Zancudomyces culisetae]|uniref:Protein ZGRF1 n=1 Tax=Zancudomyces culisetae TaxID=1213189 RepID=A0A1R1PHD3_ZANCU|nr:Protein ZGRF1 [Zancudomyces culisetae]|eukprot:OMH80262.1 Protein ZGRF1 [Zancudomyces culisetae]
MMASKLKTQKIEYYEGIGLVRGMNGYRISGVTGNNGNGGANRNFYKYGQKGAKKKSEEYQKNDTWIISQTVDFHNGIVCKSEYYGVNSDGTIMIDGVDEDNKDKLKKIFGAGLEKNQRQMLQKKDRELEREIEMYCLRMVESVNEWSILEMLDEVEKDSENDIYLRKVLIGKADKEGTKEIMAETEDEVRNGIQKRAKELIGQQQQLYKLNQEQLQVVTRAIVVHGPFGTGKSLVTAVIVVVSAALKQEFVEIFGKHPTYGGLRMLVTSMSNCAVDNVLQKIVELGFDDLARVGSRPRVSSSIRTYLMAASNADINNKFLVGATTIMCMNMGNDAKYPVVLVDEASQITEHLLAVPVLKFNPPVLVMVGDHKQLPPTMASIVTNRLRLQYRCHPKIAEIVNTLFYNKQLINGVSEAERPALITSLPPICFFNVVSPTSSTASAPNPTKNTTSCMNKMDAFQGSEKDIILFNCVKSLPAPTTITTRGQGSSHPPKLRINTFLNNPNRINVALSRSKSHCIILGNESFLLACCPLWKSIIDYCKLHGWYVDTSLGATNDTADNNIHRFAMSKLYANINGDGNHNYFSNNMTSDPPSSGADINDNEPDNEPDNTDTLLSCDLANDDDFYNQEHDVPSTGQANNHVDSTSSSNHTVIDEYSGHERLFLDIENEMDLNIDSII